MRALLPACAALFALASHVGAAVPAFAAAGAAGTVSSGFITEASGLVASRQNAGVLWTHNDSSFAGSVFALSTNGALLGRYILPGVTSGNFEDIAIGPGPSLEHHYVYLGDIGDNFASRPNILVHRFPEPAVYLHQATNPRLFESISGVQTLVLSYPDGPHDAEALVVDPFTGDLFIITKATGFAAVYQASRAQLDAGGSITLALARRIGFDRVSAADISPDGRLLALRRGNRAVVWYRGVRQSIPEMLGGIGYNAPVIGDPLELNGESLGFDSAARGYYTLGEGTSQLLFVFRRMDAGAPRPPVALIGAGETWRYRDQGTDEGTPWRQPEFNDATWASGLAQLGYGQGDERTLVSFGATNANKHVTTYFRRMFTAPAGALTNSLVLRLCFTEGAAAYLNGVEVFRRHLPPDAPFSQLAGGSNFQLQNYWCSAQVSPALLRDGTNTLAIELHRQSPAGSSLSFDAQLISGAFDRTPDGTDPAEPPDSTPPRVTFTVPLANAIVTNETVIVRGTATDNIGLARVEWRTDTNQFQSVMGTKTWSAAVPLEIGTNLVEVRAYDFRTNASAIAIRPIIRRAISRLTVATNGAGSVTPVLNGATLLVGNTYTLMATPAARHLFAGWSDGVSSNTARLTFLMQSNLVLRANFVTNPFIAAKGLYRGLFEDTNVVSHERSGALTVTVIESGKFTAALRFGGKAVSLAGQFDLAGESTRTISVLGVGPLTVSLRLDLPGGTDRITGTISGPDWTAQVLAYRAPVSNVANPSPHAGRHTLAVKGGTNVATLPGHGIGSFNIAANGLATLAGTLADGTVLAQSAPVSREGLWPFYLPLYKTRGSVLGWLTFTNDAVTSLSGRIHWIRPGEVEARPIPGGFTNTVTAVGSPYSISAATNFLNRVSNLCVIVNGVGPEPQTYCLRQVTRGTFTGPGFRALSLNLQTGVWTGSCTNPATGGVLPAKFTALLPTGTGFGHVLGTNFSAAVEWVSP